MKLNADCIREVLLELEDSLVIYTNDEGNLENKTVERYIAELRKDPEVTAESIQSWETLRDVLRTIVPEKPPEPEIHEGVPLETLEDMSEHIRHRLSRQGTPLFTISEE